jgi:predicted ATPase
VVDKNDKGRKSKDMSEFIRKLELKSFLSFGPESKVVDLTPLNVLIGPNASGKSNFIEAIELLHATPTDFSETIRMGGSAGEWLWKGLWPPKPAAINAILCSQNETPDLLHRIVFTETRNRLEILDEVLEESARRRIEEDDVFFYYRYQNGHPVLNVREKATDQEINRPYVKRLLKRESLDPEQSVLSQRKDPEAYPELTRLAEQYRRMRIFREWSFGWTAPLRRAQPADLPGDSLLPTTINLGLVLNELEHRDCWPRFEDLLRRFLPRFKRLTTKVQGNTVQIFLHEDGLKTPVPATRLSDGTLRFLALLAILLNPGDAPLVCIEEPELGLHPDALSIIGELLVEASQKTQVIVTTQSDNLVSVLTDHADSVLVTEYIENETEFRRVESAKLKHWLEKYRLGEIWRIGKVGGNP